MVEPIDIWRAANLMIKRYGEFADIEAARRAGAMLAKGDMDGRRAWLDILKAIEELRGLQPGETKH